MLAGSPILPIREPKKQLPPVPSEYQPYSGIDVQTLLLRVFLLFAFCSMHHHQYLEVIAGFSVRVWI